MRRVLHVHDRSPQVLGGAEVLLARTCELQRAAGWDVHTFTEADLSDPRPTALPLSPQSRRRPRATQNS